MKKFLRIAALALALVSLAVNAFAQTPRWKEAAEKVAPLEAAHGEYKSWSAETKAELVGILADFGELKGRDVQKVLDKKTKSKEKNKLCDKLLKAYTGGSTDAVCAETVIAALHGDEWSMEDTVWYNELMKRSGLEFESDTNYTLPRAGELTEKEAVERARNFLASQGASYLNQKCHVDATMEEDTEDDFDDDGTQISFRGRRFWSILITPPQSGDPYTGTCHVDMLATGEIIGYRLPEMDYCHIFGRLPDEGAIPEDQALAIGKRAMVDALGVSENELGTVKIFFGEVDTNDPAFTSAAYRQHVWAVHSEGCQAYALLSPGGNVIEAKKHGIYVNGRLTFN